MKECIKCTECEFCVDNRGLGNTRGSFECKHPDRAHIRDYFK